ncbi:Ribosome biogenesis protein Nop16 [Trinorchestia longiramus]|nr:Ribosome biogenesis protein Nop16 [Trinorchestia longiramus]
MGQPAGVKRRKRKVGSFKLLKNRKRLTRQKKHQANCGIPLIGLEDSLGGRSVLTRIEDGGLVANIKTHFKPDRRMFIEGIGEKLTRKPAPKKEPKETRLAENVSEVRAKAKAKVLERRAVILSKPLVKRLEYFLDRYGEDYQAMARDAMNYDQWTERQIRVKISNFKKTSYQFAEYLKERGLLRPELLSAPADAKGEQSSITVDEQEHHEAASEATAKLKKKISALEKSDRTFKKSIVTKVPGPALVRDDRRQSSEGEMETDSDEEAKEGKKSNRKRRERSKKSKKAKFKTLKKVIRRSL